MQSPVQVAPEKSLEGSIILVTGASRGIGFAAAIELARRGAYIVGTARSEEALLPLAEALGGQLTPFVAELAEPSALKALARLIEDRFGQLDGLFGNAGILGSKAPVGDLHDAEVERAIATNITSSYRLLHRAKAGRVLFVTSGVAWKRHAGWTIYAISKSALEAMIGVYANEIEGTPIRANLISPGPIRTEMRVEAWPEEDPASVPPPEDVAPIIADLLSPSTQENGAIYDFPAGRWTRNRKPD
jgi:NAD(P)-dependent dehydrogenase (short-subunit alcohol dehydrogenase family)